MKRRLSWFFAGMGLAAVAGCYQQTSENNSLVFSYQAWVPPLVALVGVALIPAGIFLFTRQQRRFAGVCVAVLGPIVAIGIAPTFYMDRVVVSEEGFYSRHGFWWDPTVHQVRFQDLNQVTLVVEEKIGRRGRKNYSYYFDCSFKQGKQERIPLGDLVRQAMPEIVKRFKEHGVPIQVPPNLPE
jgi:hypothetical protein